jgi:hypothetical protein
MTAAIAGLGGLLFGYDTGVIAGALLFHHPGLRAAVGTMANWFFNFVVSLTCR